MTDSSADKNEQYMLTERSIAGNALIFDQSNVIDTKSDYDSDSDGEAAGPKEERAIELVIIQSKRKDGPPERTDSMGDDDNEDSDYGVELSNDTLVIPDADETSKDSVRVIYDAQDDSDEDYGVEMTTPEKDQ